MNLFELFQLFWETNTRFIDCFTVSYAIWLDGMLFNEFLLKVTEQLPSLIRSYQLYPVEPKR